ncbi:MAG: class I SAM-dependent methyltransferase [Pyrinomonadaceae bacterium]
MTESNHTPDAPPRVIYDRLAAYYDRAFQPLEDKFLKRWRAETLGALPPGAFILEVGCGTGLNFSHYPAEASGVASELSREMIVRAQTKQRPQLLQLAQARAEALPFAPHTFDAAFATLVFCSVTSPPAAFAELRRVVKPGGTIALLEHVRPDNFMGPIFDAVSFVTVRLFDDHFNRQTADEARRAGLEITRIENKLRGAVQLIVCRNTHHSQPLLE